MRFDDRLTTLLAQPAANAAAKIALWAQIADVMTQESSFLSPELSKAGYERLRLWREFVPVERRLMTATALSYHGMSNDMVDFFAQDVARIAAPVLTRAKLSDAEWVQLIPGWPATSRALLRERRDLPPEANRILAAYGPRDFALPGQTGGSAESEGAQIQIRDLVARIEAYRRDHQMPNVLDDQIEIITCFRFESGNDGIINWVDGAPRGALIGISLVDMAEPGGFGVDGHAAGACRQRMQFRDAHLEVSGIGPASGAWLISANPFFNPDDGRFVGFRGIAKRRDMSESSANQLLGGNLSADSIRQLAHELRTPLNAIRGFGEMIEGQFLGPVTHHYCNMAGKIVVDASRLIGVIDDLDAAARLESGHWPEENLADASADIAEILGSVAKELRPLSDERGVRLRVVIGRDLHPIAVDRATCMRLVGRLLSTSIELAGRGEELEARLDMAAAGVIFHVDRPKSILGMSRDQILATASVGDETELALGLGFIIRLIDALASRAGGHLEIGRERFSLILPSTADSSGEQAKKAVRISAKLGATQSTAEE